MIFLVDEVGTAKTVSLEGLERRRGDLFDGSAEFLDGAEGFTEPPAELRGSIGQSFQHMFFAVGCGLFFCQDVAVGAIDRFEAQNVLIAQCCNGTIEDRRAAGTLAEFPCNFRGKPGVWRLAHQPECLLDASLGDQAEERGLFQLHGESLPKRAVEDGIACGIG